jgi:hypothetical protein
VRQTFFSLLSEYKQIDALGACMRDSNNSSNSKASGGSAGSAGSDGDAPIYPGDAWDSLASVYQQYKFVVAMVLFIPSLFSYSLPIIHPFVQCTTFHKENSNVPGYLSEKIVNAALGRAVPIFWGAPDAQLLLNPAAFVHCEAFFSYDTWQEQVPEGQDFSTYKNFSTSVQAEVFLRPMFETCINQV